MAGWQEAVHSATSHMESADTTIYLANHEDAWRVTKEYVDKVIKAHKQRNTDHAKEGELWKQAIKTGNSEDPVICLLEATHKAAHAPAERAVDIFLNKIKETLRKHVPVNTQGPLIVNALSTAFQFQMSIWWMIGDECICPLRAKHSDWCGLASIMQAIIKTFPNNCAIMFLPAPAPEAPFSSTFKPASSSSEEDDDGSFSQGPGLHRFRSDSPVPSGSGCSGFSGPPSFSSTPLPQGGHFFLASNWKGAPSSSLGAPPVGSEEPGAQPLNKELDLGLEANNEGDREKNQPGGDDSVIDLQEVKILQGIVNPGPSRQPPTMPKLGDKQGLGHLNGSGSSDSSGEDLDAKGIKNKKKGATPTKAASNPSQWTDEDIDIVRQYRYKTDMDHFKMYWRNKMDPADLVTINTKDHSGYIDMARVDPSTIIKKSIFNVAAYQEVLRLKGGDTSKFDKEVGAKFKKSAKGSWALDDTKVAIDRVMLVCQCPNGIDVVYSDPDGFGCPGTMDLWDLHSSDTLSWAKLQMKSGLVDANFCPLCAFWSTNNETLNNHICKHYKMGLTCRADGFTTASVAAMKSHMEMEHGYGANMPGRWRSWRQRVRQHLERHSFSIKSSAETAHGVPVTSMTFNCIPHSARP